VGKGFTYLVMLNELTEENIFKICAEFWFTLTTHIFKVE